MHYGELYGCWRHYKVEDVLGQRERAVLMGADPMEYSRKGRIFCKVVTG